VLRQAPQAPGPMGSSAGFFQLWPALGAPGCRYRHLTWWLLSSKVAHWAISSSSARPHSLRSRTVRYQLNCKARSRPRLTARSRSYPRSRSIPPSVSARGLSCKAHRAESLSRTGAGRLLCRGTNGGKGGEGGGGGGEGGGGGSISMQRTSYIPSPRDA